MASVVREEWDSSCPSSLATLGPWDHSFEFCSDGKPIMAGWQTASLATGSWQNPERDTMGKEAFSKSYHEYILLNPSIILISLQ